MKRLEKLVEDLQSNPSIISEFLTNPDVVVKRYKLTKTESDAIISGDIESIVNLGINNQMVAGALSGAHTGTCRPSKRPY